MKQSSSIRFLHRHEIDTIAWDNRVSKARYGPLYALSWYLDITAPDWTALVYGDYQYILPLPRRKKFFVSYIFHPDLTPQLGIIGENINPEINKLFLDSIPPSFRYWDLVMNEGNMITDYPDMIERRNYVLNLDQDYESIRARYREHVRRNIRRAEKAGCYLKTNVSVDDILRLFLLQNGSYLDNHNIATQLSHAIGNHLENETYGVYSKNGELLASALFAHFNRRWYYLIVGNHPNGKTLGASHLLIDGFIRNHSEKKSLLDFEGGNISSLAFFYSSFGAEEKKFSLIRKNNLPWWIRFFKRV